MKGVCTGRGRGEGGMCKKGGVKGVCTRRGG